MVKSKKWTFLLLTSLILNISLISFLGAQWYRHKMHPGNAGDMSFDRRAAISVLEKPERKQVKQLWGAQRDLFRQDIHAFRAAKKRLGLLLSARQLDQPALDQTFEELAAARYNVEKRLYLLLNETAETLPADVRQDFFRRGFKGWSDRHHHNKPPKD